MAVRKNAWPRMPWLSRTASPREIAMVTGTVPSAYRNVVTTLRRNSWSEKISM